MFRPIYQHLALHLLIINQWYMSVIYETCFGFESHELKSQQKHYHFFKSFVISEIILCPYLLTSTDMMKLLFYHTLVKYNWSEI